MRLRLTGKTRGVGLLTPKTAIALALIGVACRVSESLCECEPVPNNYWVHASGTITDAAGAPVANAQYMMIGMNPGSSFQPLETPPEYLRKTDASGAFDTDIYGNDLTQDVHTAVYFAGRPVVQVRTSGVKFKAKWAPADSVKLSIKLPP